MNSLPRTAFLIATIAAICFALVQVVCRVVFWQLPRLEGALNDALASQGVAVRGIEGRWNGINPGLYADRVDFPAGQASGLDFELDLLESLGRNRVVARRLTVADGHVAFDKTPMGWQLRGAPGAGGFDLRALLTHSDEVWLRGRVGLYGPSLAGTIHVESMLINQDGNHRFHIGLQTDAGCPDCALTVDGDITGDGPGAVRMVGDSVVVAGDLVDLAGLGPLFAGATAKRVGFDLGVDWRRDGNGEEHLRLRLAANFDGLPGASAQVALEAEGWPDAGAAYRGRIGTLSLRSGDAAFQLDRAGFVVRPSAGEIEMWLPTFALESLTRPVANAYGPEHALGRHIGRLTPRAWISAVGVHVDERGVAFQGHASEASTTGHKGVPAVDNATFSFAGGQHAARISLDSRDVLLAFPDYLTAYTTHDAATGSLTVVYAGDRLGLRGADILIREGGTQAAGNFAVGRRAGASHSHVIVDGRIDQVDVDTARAYVPLTLSPELRRWILDSVRSGELAGTRIVYQGRTTITDDLPWRRFELSTRFANATVVYHADWPTATDAEGQLAVTSRSTRMRGRAEAFGVHLPDLDVSVRHGADGGDRAAHAVVNLRCDTTVSRLFDFARTTPIRDALPFLVDAWSGDGQVSVAADLNIPLGDRPLNPGDVSADFVFRNADLDLADIGLAFADINERLRYEYPANLTSNSMHASLFGAPVTIGISSDADSVRFNLAGSATPDDAYRLLGMDDLGIADGQFGYDALFTVFPNVDRAMELQVASDLEGLAVRLPPPLAKSADDARTMTAAMQFLDSHVAVAARYGEADGWLHTADGSILAGAIGIGASMPMIDAAEGRVVLGGGVHEIDSETMAALLAPSTGVDWPFAWELRRFSVGRMTLDTFTVTDAMLDGFSEGGEVSFAIDAAELEGTVARSGDAPWRVKLNELHLPAPVGEGDPLTTAAMDRLLPADVELDRVTVGDEDYGSWKLGLRPDADGVTLTDVVADMRGLHIESGGDVYWSRAGETEFDGEVSARNVQDVLPLWGFAPSVESEAFHASGHVRWPGSPLNFDLAHLSGDARLRVTDGRFLDVAQGATPILSLINFSTVAKRMNLDFSDVFGSGVSFDEVIAELTVDDGLARFTRAAEIVGTGSSFRLAGTVDLDSGALDNEMVVTLPVHNSLPWAATFLALSNPAGAAAVVVGRQVFKDQIKRLTSGKYRIGGTYEEPEVEFEGVFADHVDLAAGTERSADTPVDNGDDPAQSAPATPTAAQGLAPAEMESDP